ncbi:phage antirepressor N-terminal domain-containing protein [Dechloromonas denitrificans]|uniref:phage antirepressor N-terminal domain-containing protein n=1 Tax=Dechloromonas denitrificans TaxID=281362 RepID=UPI001CFB096C|nr:phage antirepressor N-terminal domain-containing protein [Dechloromonas denitrificans]UCV08473.1 phage antirepressor N-terminal domain-containing protein [Dechloromonas denitrificans]
MADLLPVAFHGETLYLVEHNGEPFTAVKPICDAIGVDWKSQHAKLIGLGFRWSCREIPTTGADGKTYNMACLPMRKLSGWLASISAAKVKPEIRDTLIAYQDECDDALWRYWTEGHADRNAALITPDCASSLNVGDRGQSLATGRPGKVAKTYPDGSVSVCRDDGEPQAEGQGHERLPRRLLEYIPPALRTTNASRPRSENLPRLCPNGWHGERISAARQQLESASGILSALDFAPDQQTRLDLLTAAHSQCQTASLFIANHYDEVRSHA